MGGNLTVKGIQADKIDFIKIDRTKFVFDFKKLFHTINNIYSDRYIVKLRYKQKSLTHYGIRLPVNNSGKQYE